MSLYHFSNVLLQLLTKMNTKVTIGISATVPFLNDKMARKISVSEKQCIRELKNIRTH